MPVKVSSTKKGQATPPEVTAAPACFPARSRTCRRADSGSRVRSDHAPPPPPAHRLLRERQVGLLHRLVVLVRGEHGVPAVPKQLVRTAGGRGVAWRT
jgi:hypothetical protein